MGIDIQKEQYALKVFQKASKNLFNENIDSAYADLNRLVSMYEGTHIALKGWFLVGMIWKMRLYTECIVTENFSAGVKALSKNALMDLFNKECQEMVRNYELHSKKRAQAFNNLKNIISKLLEIEDYSKVYMYINFKPIDVSECTSLSKLDDIRDGHLFSEEELKKLVNDISYYLLITIVADDFDVEYTDELSSITKRKLNRVDFYHSCLTWLKKFYEYDKDPSTAELMKKCASIVLALTQDSGNFKRQEAYETIANMSKDYYSMVTHKEEIVEKDVRDVEDEFFNLGAKATKIEKDNSLMGLVACDEVCKEKVKNYSLHDSYKLALEINLAPPQEVLEAQKEFHDILDEESEEDSFGLKLEFD